MTSEQWLERTDDQDTNVRQMGSHVGASIDAIYAANSDPVAASYITYGLLRIAESLDALTKALREPRIQEPKRW